MSRQPCSVSVESSDINGLCEELSAQVYSLQYLVEHRRSWPEAADALGKARQLLESLTAKYNEFEHTAEQLYIDDLAIAEEL